MIKAESGLIISSIFNLSVACSLELKSKKYIILSIRSSKVVVLNLGCTLASPGCLRNPAA